MHMQQMCNFDYLSGREKSKIIRSVYKEYYYTNIIYYMNQVIRYIHDTMYIKTKKTQNMTKHKYFISFYFPVYFKPHKISLSRFRLLNLLAPSLYLNL